MLRQVGHDWDYVQASMDEDARSTLRKLVTTGAKASDVACLPHVVQVSFVEVLPPTVLSATVAQKHSPRHSYARLHE